MNDTALKNFFNLLNINQSGRFANYIKKNKKSAVQFLKFYIKTNSKEESYYYYKENAFLRTFIDAFWHLAYTYMIIPEKSKQEGIENYRQALQDVRSLQEECLDFFTVPEKESVEKLVTFLEQCLLEKSFDIKIIPLKEVFVKDKPITVDVTICNNTIESQEIDLLSGKLFFTYNLKSSYIGYGTPAIFRENMLPTTDTIRSTITIAPLDSFQQTIILNQENVVFNKDGKLGNLVFDKSNTYYATLSLLNKFQPKAVKFFVD